MNNYNNKSVISLPKLLAIIAYDSLIIVTLLLLATTLLFFSCLLLQFNTPEPQSIYFRLYLASIIIGYYYFSWACIKTNQTIGMRAWGVRLINTNNTSNANNFQTITLKQVLYRILFGNISFWFFGLGYILMYFNKDRKTLVDMLSKTRLTMG